MPAVVLKESAAIKALADEARNLMVLEAAASRIDLKHPDFAEVDEAVAIATETLHPRITLVQYIDAANELKRRAAYISTLKPDDDDVFRKTFGGFVPAHLQVDRRPYSIQFGMGGADYENLCEALGLEKDYRDTVGLCLTSDRTKGRIAKTLGDGIIITRIAPTIQCCTYPHGTVTPNECTEVRSGNTPETKPNSLLKRHEELHAFQSVLEAARCYMAKDELLVDLIREETAHCVSEAEHGPEKRENILHTALYFEKGIPWGDFTALAHRVYRNNTGDAEVVIRQRRLNEDALTKLYENSEPGLKKLAGWVMYLSNFFSIPQAMAAVKSEYGS